MNKIFLKRWKVFVIMAIYQQKNNFLKFKKPFVYKFTKSSLPWHYVAAYVINSLESRRMNCIFLNVFYYFYTGFFLRPIVVER